MIRIDLLPAYVATRRLNNYLIATFVVLFILVTCGALGYNYYLTTVLTTQNDLATADAAERTKIDGITAQATAVTGSIAPIANKLNFVNAVEAYNDSWPALYDRIARYTDPKVIYSSANVSGTGLTINAYTPSIEEVGLYLEEMYKEPDINSVTIDHLPGYPDAVVNKYYLFGKLIAVGQLPGQGEEGGGPNGPGQGAYGPNGPQGMYGGGPQQGGPMGFGGGGGGTAFGSALNPLAVAETPQADLNTIVNSEVSPLATGDQVTRLRALVRARLLKQVVVKHQVRGFNITVDATLKQGFTPPAIPAATSAAPAAGGSTFGGPQGAGG